MSAADIIRPWQKAVKSNLLPTLHAHQAKALALLSGAMALAGSCCAGAIASRAPTANAKPASVRRRMERVLANERLDAPAAMLQMTRSLLADWGGRKLLLTLDETPKANDLRCMKLSVAYHKRTVTLLSICYPPDHPPMAMPRLVRRMLRLLASRLPAEVTVTLLADRGLCWPTVIRRCRRLGWHYLLRLQGDARVKLADGTERSAAELAPRRGARCFLSDVRVFKKARWLKANVVAVWEEHGNGPWLLVTDGPASYACCRGYCKRTWCEESHRDEKSHGLNWQQSRVNDPAHAQRLVLLMALASLLCIAAGVAALKRGLRRKLFEPRARRLLSVFKLGQRWLEYAMTHEQPLPLCSIALPPP